MNWAHFFKFFIRNILWHKICSLSTTLFNNTTFQVKLIIKKDIMESLLQIIIDFVSGAVLGKAAEKARKNF